MQDSNIKNISNSLDQQLLNNQPNYDLVIVGAGISCAYTLINYINRLQAKLKQKVATDTYAPIKVAVIDKSGEFWTGIPYGQRSGQQSLIITALDEFLPKPERDRFINWLNTNYNEVLDSLKQRSGVLTQQWLQAYEKAMLEGNWDKLFIPRYVFGWYVTQQVNSLLAEAQQGYLTCDLFTAEVFNIQKIQDNYQVEFTTSTSNNSMFTARQVILAIGSPPNKASFVQQFEAQENTKQNICFIGNMYEPSQDYNIEQVNQFLTQSSSNQKLGNQVLIIGSNASALETLYSLNNLPHLQNKISKYIIISPNAEFPHRIYEQPVSTTYTPQNLISLVKTTDFTAKQILEAVKKDVQAIADQNETISSTYALISQAVINALNKLSLEEQRQFVVKYGVEIGKFQRRAGTDYLDVVDKLIFQGKIEFIKGKFVKTIPLQGETIGFEFITPDGTTDVYTNPIKVIINCAGFQNVAQSSSPLIANLIQQGICTPNESLCGFEMNKNFEANDNFYLMGPLVAGNINDRLKVWHAESCGRIISLSQQLAEVLI
ncbi:beta-lactamase domain-containing protein [Chondrocystis sp. NIES-4102]|nr:beta-lactamase domain-containing protein [Chondrocystis sp. NIES-4102]